MNISRTDKEEKRKKKGLIGSFIYTIVLIIALLFPLLSYQFPPPGMEGIRISFGQPDQGDGTEQPKGEPIPASSPQETQPTESAESPQETAQSEPTKAAEPIAEAAKASPPPTPVKEQPDPPIKKKVATADNSKEIAAALAKKKKQEEEKKKKQQEAAENAKKAKELADKKSKADAEKAKKLAAEKAKEAKKTAEKAEKLAAEEAKRKAAEAKAIAEAKKKAEEERKYQDAKDKLGSLFGQSGSQGNSGKPGDAGVANGDPDAKNLEGTKSYGKGDKDVGGGLSGRGVLKRPSLEDNSQKEGKVKVEICVNKSGKVIKAEYSQFGSTTIDTDLIELAEASAKKYQFTPSINPEQCGEVLITFSLQ